MCPECGSDEQTGWSEAAREDSLGLPDDSFNYDEFVTREFEPETSPRKHWFWWLVAIAVLAAMALWFFH